MYTSGKGVDIEGVVDCRQFCFRTGGFADMQGPAVGASEGSGGAPLYRQDFPQRRPALRDSVFLEPADALLQFVEPFLAARLIETVGDFLQSGLEAFAQALIDALLFFCRCSE